MRTFLGGGTLDGARILRPESASRLNLAHTARAELLQDSVVSKDTLHEANPIADRDRK
jgi:hypothetical protein